MRDEGSFIPDHRSSFILPVNPPRLAGRVTGRTSRAVPQVHVLAEVVLPRLGMLQHFIRGAVTEHLARLNHVQRSVICKVSRTWWSVIRMAMPLFFRPLMIF